MGESNEQPEISVVIPAYNEEENLPLLVPEIRHALDPLSRPYELIIVDDGSTDSTAEVLAQLAAADARLRPIYFDGNFGQSSAFDAGIRAARGSAVVLIDADLQNDPADIPKLLEKLDDFDAAVGWRKNRRDPWTKKLTSRFSNWVKNRATGDRIHDTGCSLKAFRAEAIRSVKLFDGMHRFLPTLLRLEGHTLTEVPVNHRPRRHGRSKYHLFNRAVRPTLDLLAVIWMRRRAFNYKTRQALAAAESVGEPPGPDEAGAPETAAAPPSGRPEEGRAVPRSAPETDPRQDEAAEADPSESAPENAQHRPAGNRRGGRGSGGRGDG